ncbi:MULTISPECIES: AMP-dependent synthetase/ligase [unclassified Tolypothrix]|uniref:AMP-dependent synthetase/ligase n=1 Tax=unclassified Tolypothrix TaxID=2649714 RepID=UPI0005EABA72|nr:MULTISPECIES: long-chain fatty acid--CoA ligase [unclassified Tolypothrix]BAY93138.1 AMP-dependent synthetase and ligase [Microchaete diplosiphon NIES-3275]EKF00397.1 AMP-binding enzyme [Tolypothrix sp. PCC 7601]MBE9084805.1 long-chain fatty acid--CoA ligase [Tolypothrix sp. LEGE 11397]UYD27014.1 long-chain fatty acid--CoA ligase [Tolypothrix sp. PCC 7712]UYD37127.1 long-chain fatty acid--CoA ligase [Tolypothrix sp. PCC 7601]
MSKTQSAAIYLSNISEQERLALKRLKDYTHINAIPEIWPLAAKSFGDTVALHNPHAKPEVVITYKQLAELIQKFAAGLQVLGVKAGDRLSLIADNSPRWFVADQGIMTAGAVDAVRSSQAEKEELLFIIANSGSTGLVLEDLKTLQKLRDRINDLPVQFVILLSDETPPEDSLKILNFSQLLEIGANNAWQPVEYNQDNLATLIYTSGTTGKPKGVMLAHSNLIHQITTMGTVVQPNVGDIALSILPSWHSYERTVEYFLLSQGCTQIYTNLRAVKNDLKNRKPHFMVAVPRLWESIYEGAQKQFREQPANKQRLINFFFEKSDRYIKAKRIAEGVSLEHLESSAVEKLTAKIQAAALFPLHALGERLVYAKVREATGGRIKQVISGGGALPKHIDMFFEIIGVEILQGYGLTETSPVTNVRRPWHNVRGSSGQTLPATETKIVDPETRKPLPIGERGLVLLKGPQIMQGYYQNPEATAKAIDADGWFDSGDLGWLTPQNDLVLTGRAKDTIVLTNGENIEPQPIEDACLRSPYIDQIMLVGQDQRSLGALIVPNLEALVKWAETQNIDLSKPNEDVTASASQKIDLESKIIQELFRKELNREVQNRPGYRADDRIGPFKLIPEPFSIENGLMTQTLKIRRHVVSERYRDIVNAMFA